MKKEKLEIVQKTNLNTYVDNIWVKKVKKLCTRTIQHKPEVEEIKESSLNFIISNFNCENTKGIKAECLKQCKGIL